jgi:hypothetical protein
MQGLGFSRIRKNKDVSPGADGKATEPQGSPVKVAIKASKES